MPTYDLRITFLTASSLPTADLSTLSSDPYLTATLLTSTPTQSSSNPPLNFRTPTVRRTTTPTWNTRWDIFNVPRASKLRITIFDEDALNADDKLGHAFIDFSNLEHWDDGEANEGQYKLHKKGASKKAAVLKLCVGEKKKRREKATVRVRIEVLGETRLQEGYQGIGRPFTAGPNYWSKHFSPLIGKAFGTQDSPKTSTYSFEANKLQLSGPAPPDLNHRFVEFAPFVTAYFSRSGLKGRVLNRALHSQYNHLYCHDTSTEYGLIDPSTSASKNALAQKFLDMAHWDEGHRLFTYVITLDAEWRFTETGDEFAVDLLSKHSLHSDVAKYIAFSGEFFIRRIRRPHSQNTNHHIHNRPPPTDNTISSSSSSSSNNEKPLTGPSHYELIIDNDSGTYRPNKDLLPLLQHFLSSNLTGIGKITTYDCFDPELKRLKKERKDAKQAAGHHIFRQRSMSSGASSISSSEEEELETGVEGNVVKRRWNRWMVSGTSAKDGAEEEEGGNGNGQAEAGQKETAKKEKGGISR